MVWTRRGHLTNPRGAAALRTQCGLRFCDFDCVLQRCSAPWLKCTLADGNYAQQGVQQGRGMLGPTAPGEWDADEKTCPNRKRYLNAVAALGTDGRWMLADKVPTVLRDPAMLTKLFYTELSSRAAAWTSRCNAESS